MIEITLTEFVDFVIKSGTPKLTQVRKVKQRHAKPYDPKKDFYKAIREGIIDIHKANASKASLNKLLSGISDPKKRTGYPPLIAGYQKFLGAKKAAWFAPPKSLWRHSQVAVSVNPELGLNYGGQDRVIKLYFKSDPLTKLRVDIINHLMQTVLEDANTTREFGILDVRNSRLIAATEVDVGLHALLQGEAASFAQIYSAI